MKRVLLLFGMMFSILTAFAGSIVIIGIALIMSLSNGVQEYIKWRGLYNFLKGDTLINEKTYIELPLWEKYLVYATAFGISEKVVEAIRVRCITVPPYSSIASTSHYRLRHIHHHSSTIRRSVHTSSMRHHSSSYSGMHNAGGRGIGGGGGGH